MNKLSDCIVDLKKLFAIAPYDTSSNMCANDSYFGASIRSKYSDAMINKAKAKLGLPLDKESSEKAPAKKESLDLGRKDNGLRLSTKIKNWKDIEKKLKSLKKIEAKLRNEIAEEMFEGRQGKFTVKNEFDDIGLKVTASSKTTMSLDEKMLSEMGDLNKSELACLKSKISLVASGIKELDDDSMLWNCITEKPAMPTLAVTEI